MYRNESVTESLSLFGRLLRPLQQFLQLEAASGIVLLACAAAALVWANVAPESYVALTTPAHVAVNDGLMTLFFFVVGLEIKRELSVGELRDLRSAVLPAVAALGGMIVPAAIFLACTGGTAGRAGWGIPMATDIAFSVGVLALLGGRVPRALVVFLTALAIFDDLGGIAVIALFYGGGLDARWFAIAVAVIVGLVNAGRHGTHSPLVYGLLGVVLWYALHRAGIHPAIAGVATGLAVTAPLPLQRFEHVLHPWVAFAIMPLFALVNAGVPLRLSSALSPVSLGCALGLFAGKPLGIFVFTSLAARFGLAPVPGTARTLCGVSMIAGIGFTVALFIAGLAYPDSPELLDEAKLGIVAGSLLSAIAGFACLRFATPRSVPA